MCGAHKKMVQLILAPDHTVRGQKCSSRSVHKSQLEVVDLGITVFNWLLCTDLDEYFWPRTVSYHIPIKHHYYLSARLCAAEAAKILQRGSPVTLVTHPLLLLPHSLFLHHNLTPPLEPSLHSLLTLIQLFRT